MMMDAKAALETMQADLFSHMGTKWIETFIAFLRGKAEVAAYDCSQIGVPEEMRRDLMATIRFCHSFADKAETALNAQKAAATADGEGGFRQ